MLCDCINGEGNTQLDIRSSQGSDALLYGASKETCKIQCLAANVADQTVSVLSFQQAGFLLDQMGTRVHADATRGLVPCSQGKC